MILFDRTRAVGVAVIGLAFVCVGLFAVVQGHVPFGLLAVVFGGGVVASSFRHVLVTQEGVRLRYVWRSVFVPWEEVVAFDRRTTPNWFGERLKLPVVILTNGSHRLIPGANQAAWLPKPHARLRVVDALEALRREHQQRGRSAT